MSDFSELTVIGNVTADLELKLQLYTPLNF